MSQMLKNKTLLVFLLGVAFLASVVYFALPALTSVSYSEPTLTAAEPGLVPEAQTHIAAAPEAPSLHVPPPEDVKAIYMSQCVVGTVSFRDSLVKLVEDTELNAIIIDVQDYTGKISFPTDHPLLQSAVSDTCGARDMQAFIALLHEKNIYVIGRITVFQNPYYTSQHPDQAVQAKGGSVWTDYNGLAFVDVGAKPYWDYVVALGKESYAIGFDELNFDYVRYPSDGPMAFAVYSHSVGKKKAEVLEEFFKYLTDNLRPGAVLSADLFGMVATNYDDLGIGQVLERALPYFDHIYPMVYPSHYPKGFNGYSNVNEHAYDIIKFAMDNAVRRTQATTTEIASFAFEPIPGTSPQLYKKPAYPADKIRPWLQSFDYPVTYTPAMVEEQIKAANDAGLHSWAFWDAGNKYNALRRVVAEE